MIQEYVSDIASQMGVKLSNVSLSELSAVSSDYLLGIESKGHVVSTLIHQSELDDLQQSSCSGFLELRIKAALERLKTKHEP